MQAARQDLSLPSLEAVLRYLDSMESTRRGQVTALRPSIIQFESASDTNASSQSRKHDKYSKPGAFSVPQIKIPYLETWLNENASIGRREKCNLPSVIDFTPNPNDGIAVDQDPMNIVIYRGLEACPLQGQRFVLVFYWAGYPHQNPPWIVWWTNTFPFSKVKLAQVLVYSIQAWHKIVSNARPPLRAEYPDLAFVDNSHIKPGFKLSDIKLCSIQLISPAYKAYYVVLKHKVN
ncbi:hypothetical protein C8Q75DRAFT_780106 [Abortiporus biennis]|nr:hypothetical protein C8Q75DRAFT_780106 [Abortiporus biennis]